MCAEYQVNKQPYEIREWIKRYGESESENNYNPRIKLFSRAPVIVGEDMEIQTMRFSLKPPATKFATFNARLFDFDEKANKVTTIADKRTWKKPFAESRCLVPMTGFIEPIYTGDFAGKMVEFREENDQLIFAAGIWEESIDPKTQEKYCGFALVMDKAIELVKATGHHRSPRFILPTSFSEWQSADNGSDEALNVLATSLYVPKLKVIADRPMAKGWEKRIKTNVEASEWEDEFEKLRS